MREADYQRKQLMALNRIADQLARLVASIENYPAIGIQAHIQRLDAQRAADDKRQPDDTTIQRETG